MWPQLSNVLQMHTVCEICHNYSAPSLMVFKFYYMVLKLQMISHVCQSKIEGRSKYHCNPTRGPESDGNQRARYRNSLATS